MSVLRLMREREREREKTDEQEDVPKYTDYSPEEVQAGMLDAAVFTATEPISALMAAFLSHGTNPLIPLNTDEVDYIQQLLAHPNVLEVANHLTNGDECRVIAYRSIQLGLTEE
ncbi:hypothetical protein KIPB_003764, partial [Kipferlia bialata]|eukprot:g3764.t1